MKGFDYWLQGGGDPLGEGECEWRYDTLLEQVEKAFSGSAVEEKFWTSISGDCPLNDSLVECVESIANEGKPCAEAVRTSYNGLATEAEVVELVNVFTVANNALNEIVQASNEPDEFDC